MIKYLFLFLNIFIFFINIAVIIAIINLKLKKNKVKGVPFKTSSLPKTKSFVSTDKKHKTCLSLVGDYSLFEKGFFTKK